MDILVETAVSGVTVYPDRARVTVKGDCELTTGTQRLLVPDLPLTMETESIRISGRGSARVRLHGVDVTPHFYEETPAANVQALEQQIEQLEEEMRVIEDQKAGWLEHGKYLNGLRQATTEFAKGLSRGKTTVADQADLIAFLRQEDEGLRSAVRDLDQQQRDLNKKLQKLRQELKQLQSAQPKRRFQAQVEVEVLAAGSLTLTVSYVVGKAGWQPLYDMRLVETAENPRLEITAIAQISQNTGQDWPGVSLVVSTARPALNQRLPELTPWFIDEYAPPPPPPKVRAAAPASPQAAKKEVAAMSVADAEPEPEMEEAEVVTATVQSERTAVTFAVEGSVDIPSDGSPHKNVMQQFDLEPELDYLAIPRHTDAVYRRVTVTNTSPGPFLPGAVSLFAGDEYIGRNRLNYVPVGDEVELMLGVEERITVKRELMKRDVDKRFLRDQRQLRYGFEIELKNLLETAVQVELHDQIPVSRHEQIKVKLDSVRPDPSQHSDLNLLEWTLTLDPQAEQTIGYEYVVEHPRHMRVSGLRDK